MNNQEYEQKKRECWRIYAGAFDIKDEIPNEAFNWVFDRAYALGKQEKDADTVIQGWVARDMDGLLNFFYGGSTPYKNDNDGDWNTAFGRVLEYLPREMFPDLTWDDDPIEVELTIKRKKKNL